MRALYPLKLTKFAEDLDGKYVYSWYENAQDGGALMKPAQTARAMHAARA